MPVKHDFQNWKSSLATDCPGPLWEIRKEFYSYLAAKTSTAMPLKQVSLIIRRIMVRLQIVSGDIYPQLNKSCSCGDYVTRFGQMISWRDLKIQNTLFEATSSATLHWSMKKSPRFLARVEDWWPKKKSSSFAMWSWVTMACSGIR